MKKIGLTIVASLASLSTGLMTAHAAVQPQSQSQTIQVQQGQSIAASQDNHNHVNETNTMDINTNQVQVQAQANGAQVVNIGQNNIQNTETTSSNNPSGSIATQYQGIQLNTLQQQGGSGLVTPSVTPSNIGNSTTNVSDKDNSKNSQNQVSLNPVIGSLDTTLTPDLSLANSILAGPSDPSAFTGPVLGYAVFDLRGNEISDNYGAPGNAKNHYDEFQPNQPVVLLLMPVGSNGKPVSATSRVDVLLKSSNPSSKMTVDGHTFDGLIINAGSYGVPFVYTNTGSSASFDVIDRYFQKDKNNNSDTKVSVTPQSPGSSQSTSVHAAQSENGSSSSSMDAVQVQTTGAQSQQTQDSASQNSSDSTNQIQEIKTSGDSKLSQQQCADVQTNSAESSSTSTDPSGTHHIQLGQSQSLQSGGTGTASEAEGTAFGATGSMEIHFYQNQQSSTGDALQSQGIDVAASNPGGAVSGGGNLSVYLNGSLSGSYSGVTGNVTASQSQTTDTSGNPTANQESDTVTYQLEGKTVSVQVG